MKRFRDKLPDLGLLIRVAINGATIETFTGTWIGFDVSTLLYDSPEYIVRDENGLRRNVPDTASWEAVANGGWIPVGNRLWVKEVPKPEEWSTFGDRRPACGDDIVIAVGENGKWLGRVRCWEVAMESGEGVISLSPWDSPETYYEVPFCNSTRWRPAPAPEPIKHSTDGIPPDTNPAPPTPAEAIAEARHTLESELLAAVELFEKTTGATVDKVKFPMAAFGTERKVFADITL